MTSDPAEIRKRIQTIRKSQDPNQARLASQMMCEALLKKLTGALKIALYRPLPEEPDLNHLAGGLREARLFYPRIVDPQAKVMEFLEAPPGSTWVKGPYGIEEPTSVLPPVKAGDLDLIVVPGVVFSPKGERIGRGAGYYDRALKNAAAPLKVALAFDFQVLDSLPQHSEDQKVDWVLTECRDLRNPKVAAWLNSH